MTYITLLNDMRLVVTKNTPIYRGDNLNTNITFLLPVNVGNIDMSTATVFLSYVRADGEPDMIILEQSSEKYNLNYFQYSIPVTCKLSRYPGQISMWLQICHGDVVHPTIAKSGECYIQIHESKSFDNCMHDHQLTAMYQLKKQCENISNQHEEDCTWGDIDSSDVEDGMWEDMVVEDLNSSNIWENM